MRLSHQEAAIRGVLRIYFKEHLQTLMHKVYQREKVRDKGLKFSYFSFILALYFTVIFYYTLYLIYLITLILFFTFLLLHIIESSFNAMSKLHSLWDYALVLMVDAWCFSLEYFLKYLKVSKVCLQWQPSEVFLKKVALKSFTKFMRKHLCWGPLLQAWPAILFKKTKTLVSSYKFCEIFYIHALNKEW